MLSPFIPQVAQSFLAALQNDERANYQLDVKFQESYLSKVVSLLQCHLSEGAVSDKEKTTDSVNEVPRDETARHEIEEGELPDSHGKSICRLLSTDVKLLASAVLTFD